MLFYQILVWLFCYPTPPAKLSFLWNSFVQVSYYIFNLARVSLREKCPNTELFLVWIWKIRTRNNSVFEHFLRSVYFLHTWRKVSVHETFRTLSCYFLNVLCTFSLRPLSRGSTVTTLLVLLISHYLKWISFHLFFLSFFTRILCRL